ncbi:GrpB-like predicted nucleotidyltransferase (UPF0157 family) [Bacillus horti]|uniref:GrpB-like predicted nucleotidyltransferase (UPF0157 family) n=1 Tax=Caldalkalibacillus horti TaxID=77523 RepID=A0ABT9VXJ4_9BACI|nr:GrpB-like predicted nucleotidyltransferase (UPF0157 family) [Bacillus horti]
MNEEIIIDPYNNEWPGMFEVLRNKMIHQIGTAIIRIDHIGSTAIPGLAAKPIIDL